MCPRLFPHARLTFSLIFALLSFSGFCADRPQPPFHPKIFELIECWISDAESPVVTEINLDAAAANRNQFDPDSIKPDDSWWRWDNPETRGFLRYRIVNSKGSRYTIEFQNNGGGTLTTRAIIVVTIEKRKMLVDGTSRAMRVLHVESYSSK